jgi:hypothetical protein
LILYQCLAGAGGFSSCLLDECLVTSVEQKEDDNQDGCTDARQNSIITANI